MKMESGDFVMPGDFLSVSEEFLPGQGAYEDDGSVIWCSWKCID